MTGAISPARFHQSEGTDDWRVVGDGACAHFRTDSYAEGLRLVQAVADLAGEAGAVPDADLRPEGVTFRLIAVTEDSWRLTEDHVAMARDISSLARGLGLVPDPAAVQTVQVTIGAHVPSAVMPFWKAILAYQQIGEEDLIDPLRRGAPFWFQELSKPREHRNRIHVDVFVSPDHAEARVKAALAVGGRLLDDGNAPAWWTLADPVGNVADIATQEGRE